MKELQEKVNHFLEVNGYRDLHSYNNHLPTCSKVKGFTIYIKKSIYPNYDLKYVIVTPFQAFIVAINTPYNYSYWNILKEYHYTSKADLLEFLDSHVNEKIESDIW